VDLAGSEKTDKTKSEETVLRQANYINKSLSFLEQVVLALTQTHRKHVPYRQCKLTLALKDCLGGSCLTHLIACVWPSEQHAWESVSTLRFAQRMRSVLNTPLLNDVATKDNSATVKSLRTNLNALRAELVARDVLHGGESWVPELTHQQKLRTYRMVDTFLLDEDGSSLETVKFQSLSHINLFMKTIRDVVRRACGDDIGEVASVVRRILEPLESEVSSTTVLSLPRIPAVTSRFTTVEESVLITARNMDSSKGNFAVATDLSSPNETDKSHEPLAIYVNANETLITEAIVSFDDFKLTDEGFVLNERYELLKGNVAKCKSTLKSLVHMINLVKQQIDEVTQSLQERVDYEREGGLNTEGLHAGFTTALSTEDVEEDRRMLATLKGEYKRTLGELKDQRLELEGMQSSKQTALNALLQAYKAANIS
jgi:kinesin family protein 6/9